MDEAEQLDQYRDEPGGDREPADGRGRADEGGEPVDHRAPQHRAGIFHDLPRQAERQVAHADAHRDHSEDGGEEVETAGSEARHRGAAVYRAEAARYQFKLLEIP